ncbi:MAG TPA: hypothetical protein VKO87_07830 [Gemmatimonadaceae bacterium]|nr:hypothetical protein [Gemmatimonadaceae bacterium]
MATMDAAELRDLLDKLGLKQSGPDGLETFLSVGPATVRRWARDAEDTSPIPESVAILLRLMAGMRLKPQNVLVRYGRRRNLGKPDSRAAHADSRVAGGKS